MSTATTHTGTNIAFIIFSAAVVFPEKVGTFAMMTGLIPKTRKPIDRVNSKCFHGMMMEKGLESVQ